MLLDSCQMSQLSLIQSQGSANDRQNFDKRCVTGHSSCFLAREAIWTRELWRRTTLTKTVILQGRDGMPAFGRFHCHGRMTHGYC